MRTQGLLFIGNFLLFFIAGFLAVGLQCSLWLQTLGSTPAPLLWLPFLVYFTLYRYRFESIFGVYMISLIASSFSALPFGLMLLTNILLAFGIHLFKERIYWSGAGFFALMVAGASFVYPIVMIIISWLFDKNPIRTIHIFSPVLIALLTTLSSFPMYSLFMSFDRWTRKELPTEAGTQVL
jgi:hypothetical protein